VHENSYRYQIKASHLYEGVDLLPFAWSCLIVFAIIYSVHFCRQEHSPGSVGYTLIDIHVTVKCFVLQPRCRDLLTPNPGVL